MATKRRVKKNIKEDQLVTYAVEASRWAQEHFNQIIVGVVALVAIITVVVFTANSRQSASAQASRQLANAMALFQQGDMEAARTSFNQVHQRYGGRDAAIAHFFEAEAQLRQGALEDAIGNYDAYIEQSSKYPVFYHSALIGKMLCLEALEEYEAAAALGEQVLTELPADDPRYLDVSYETARYLQKTDNDDRALAHYRHVAENADGELKHLATVAVSTIEARSAGSR